MDHIKNAHELVSYFVAGGERVFVTSAVRREFLCGERQGCFIRAGTVRTLQFRRMGGGVWEATE